MRTVAGARGGFLRDSGGNVAIMTALALVPLIGVVGAALDYSRAWDTTSKLHRAADAAALAAAGAVATLGPVPVGADGSACPTALDERAIGLSATQLGRIPFVVAAAAGADAVDPLRAALHGGLVHAAVTDVATARALLGEDPPS